MNRTVQAILKQRKRGERERRNDGNGRISEARCWGLGVDLYLETKAGNGGVVIQACYTNQRERTGGFGGAKREEGEKRGERTATNTRIESPDQQSETE